MVLQGCRSFHSIANVFYEKIFLLLLLLLLLLYKRFQQLPEDFQKKNLTEVSQKEGEGDEKRWTTQFSWFVIFLSYNPMIFDWLADFEGDPQQSAISRRLPAPISRLVHPPFTALSAQQFISLFLLSNLSYHFDFILKTFSNS